MIVSLAGFLLLGVAAGTKAQPPQGALTNYTGITVEPSPQLFATMCALDAAGFGADESTLAEMPSRLALRADLLKMQGPAADSLRQFYNDHILADPGETLSQYITFALLVGPPPNFRFQVNHDLLPPDVLGIDGFQEVIVNFYREAQLDTRWAKIEPEYVRAAARYQPPLRKIVTISNAYLRELVKPQQARTFTVFVEPLVGNRTNFRNFGDRYAMVVGSSAQIPADVIQHSYLHFILDPLPLRYRDQIMSRKALLNFAARAPLMPVEYRTDFLGLADECLIKAVELRLRRLPPAQLDASLRDADQAGFVLVRPLVAGLQKFEKAEPAMSYYFPDLIAGINVETEQERLQSVRFAPVAPAPQRRQAEAGMDQLSELDAWLAQGNHEVAAQDASAATATFEKILEKFPDEPRAIYGLAIASVLGGHAARAKDLFLRLVSGPAPAASESQKTVGPSDPTILAWSHVYLGRIYDLEGEREEGLAEYRAAIAIAGAPEAARVAAEHGMEAAYDPRARESQTNGTINTKGPKSP